MVAYNNPPVPWSTLEKRLSGTGRPEGPAGEWLGADGGDSPAWSRKRQPYAGAAVGRRQGTTPYAELHCHSNFSFLDGASHPEELAEEAARLGLEALALTDHDGFYGVVRFAEAARAQGLPTVFGAELTLDRTQPQLGIADPGVPEPNAPTPPGYTKGRRAGAVELGELKLAELDVAPGLTDTGSLLDGETHLLVLA